MRAGRLLLFALLLPCARALAASSPCVDTSMLKLGAVYEAAERIGFARGLGGQPDPAAGSDRTFTIAEIVQRDGVVWYQVQTGESRWGWTSSKLLDGKVVEPSDSSRVSDDCVPEQARVCHRLDEVARDYAALEKSPPPVAQLIALDERVRKLVKGASCSYFDGCPNEVTSEVVGVYSGHYETFEYHGKILVDAYRADPSSPLRPITLYATVEPHEEEGDPDHRAAKAYLREFPEGPYAADCALALAWAYASAWASLEKPVVQDCIPKDLDDLNGESQEELRDYAAKTADSWFQELFRLRKLTPDERDSYEKWRESKENLRNCGGC